MDLKALGRVLRHRREALDLTREEIARRVDVTPAYIFLIETARPRQSGTPSRPKRETLKRWTQALGMSDEQASTALQLAGYHPLDLAVESQLASLRDVPEMTSRMYAGTTTGSPLEVRTGGPDDWTDARQLYQRLDAILEGARGRGTWDTAIRELRRALDRVEERLQHSEEENR